MSTRTERIKEIARAVVAFLQTETGINVVCFVLGVILGAILF